MDIYNGYFQINTNQDLTRFLMPSINNKLSHFLKIKRFIPDT
jgi:hypothetical protein